MYYCVVSPYNPTARSTLGKKWKHYYNNYLHKLSLLIENFGGVALLWQNAKFNANPGLGHFEWSALACKHAPLKMTKSRIYITFCISSKVKQKTLDLSLCHTVSLNYPFIRFLVNCALAKFENRGTYRGRLFRFKEK